MIRRLIGGLTFIVVGLGLVLLALGAGGDSLRTPLLISGLVVIVIVWTRLLARRLRGQDARQT